MPGFLPSLRRLGASLALGTVLLGLAMCGKKEEPAKKPAVAEVTAAPKDPGYFPDHRPPPKKKESDKKTAQTEPEKSGKRKPRRPDPDEIPPPPVKRSPEEIAARSKKIVGFTGARTKLVWNETQNLKKADPFSLTDGQLLRGLDTSDPRGERNILEETDNYSRPLISPDGETIVFTRRAYDRKGKTWRVELEMFRTDWKGSPPESLGEGYALDIWRDPNTGLDWVYAGTDVPPQEERTFNFNKLVRFQLDAPKKLEVVWQDTPLSPENIQLSRDGLSICALLPWPNGGVLRKENGTLVAHKFATGCWPSHSPDNSYISWVFDGDHHGATLFAADGTKYWDVPFNTAPQLDHSEVYHPRWTNHPRFVVLTGPYHNKDGPAISKTGTGAQVQLCRFSPKLDKIEETLQITDGVLSEGFPAAWIEGADKVELVGFEKHAPAPVAGATGPAKNAWPAKAEGLVFLWTDRPSLNNFTGRDGHSHQAVVQTLGAARSGRFNEIDLDGGSLKLSPDSAALVTAAWNQKPEAAFEALFLPAATPKPNADGELFGVPGFALLVKDQHLIVVTPQGGWQTPATLPVTPFHLAVSRSAKGPQVWVNGKESELASYAIKIEAREGVNFGSWNGGILRIALYDRELTAEEAAANAAQAAELVSHFPPAAPQVKVTAKLVTASPVPQLETIQPYTGCLIACVYEVEKVESGELKDKRILVEHWGLLNRQDTAAFPREVGKSYSLTLEKVSDHANLKGERVNDDTGAFDLEPWLDVATPVVK